MSLNIITGSKKALRVNLDILFNLVSTYCVRYDKINFDRFLLNQLLLNDNTVGLYKIRSHLNEAPQHLTYMFFYFFLQTNLLTNPTPFKSLEYSNFYGITPNSGINQYKVFRSENSLDNIGEVIYSTRSGLFLKNLSLNNILTNVLRVSKIFNKGRYSRNRQTYRTGVYWCLYFNLLFILTAYYYFYKFTFNFGYLWYLSFFMLITFSFNRFYSLGLYNFSFVRRLVNTFINLFYQTYTLVRFFFLNLKLSRVLYVIDL